MTTYRLTPRAHRLRDALAATAAGVLVGIVVGLTICSPFVVWLGGVR